MYKKFMFFFPAHNIVLKQVVVRIRPTNNNGIDGDRTVKRVSSDTLCVEDKEFTFDSVFDSNSSQVNYTPLYCMLFVVSIFVFP